VTGLAVRLRLLLLFSLFGLRLHATEADLAAVQRADEARLQAMTAGDGAALGRVLADGLVFGHSDGRLESKAEYVKNLMDGDTAYADARVDVANTTQIAPDVIVRHGRQSMRKKLGSNWNALDLRFMAVWRKESDGWRMVSWQSLRPTGSSVVPK
jgi:ketosteroid isomerase-like protein